MKDQQYYTQFLKQDGPYSNAKDLDEKVIFVLNEMGMASADELVRRMEELEPHTDHKPLISEIHRILTELFEKGVLSGTDRDGNLIYGLKEV